MIYIFDIIGSLLNTTLLLFLEMAQYILLGLLFVGLMNLFVTRELIIKHVGNNSILSVFKSALLGIPLPLCSCGVVPTSIHMVNNGASKPAVVAFLTSTPQTGIDSIIATYGMMGPVFGVFRPIAALMMGLISGITANLFTKKDDLKPKRLFSLDNMQLKQKPVKDSKYYYDKLIKYPFFEFLDDISTHFIIGIIVAGIITFSIPENFFSGSLIGQGIAGMLLLLLVSIPMYVCATASIPIAVGLIMKGFSPGVAFVFLAAGPAVNAATLSLISKSIGKRTTVIYVTMISIMSILFGLLLDWIFLVSGINVMTQIAHFHGHDMGHVGLFQWILGVLFFVLLVLSIYRKFIAPKLKKSAVKFNNSITARQIKIEGMTCNHCVMTVEKSISATRGVASVHVSLNDGTAFVEGDYDFDTLKKNIEEQGYKVFNE